MVTEMQQLRSTFEAKLLGFFTVAAVENMGDRYVVTLDAVGPAMEKWRMMFAYMSSLKSSLVN